MSKYWLFALILVVIILCLFMAAYLSATRGFDELHNISSQIIITFELGGQIASIFEYFYFSLIFSGQPEYKIKNDVPTNQLSKILDTLFSSNDDLLTYLSTSDKGISDPVIKGFLMDNLCSQIPVADKSTCLSLTEDNSFGLLGFNSMFYQSVGLTLRDYITNGTRAFGVNYLNDATNSNPLRDFNSVAIDAYEALATYLFSKYKASIEQNKDDNLAYFGYVLGFIIVSMILMRIVVISKYRSLDLAVKKVLKLIPYNVMEKNKVLIYYLSKEFRKEMSDINIKM